MLGAIGTIVAGGVLMSGVLLSGIWLVARIPRRHWEAEWERMHVADA